MSRMAVAHSRIRRKRWRHTTTVHWTTRPVVAGICPRHRRILQRRTRGKKLLPLHRLAAEWPRRREMIGILHAVRAHPATAIAVARLVLLLRVEHVWVGRDRKRIGRIASILRRRRGTILQLFSQGETHQLESKPHSETKRVNSIDLPGGIGASENRLECSLAEVGRPPKTAVLDSTPEAEIPQGGSCAWCHGNREALADGAGGALGRAWCRCSQGTPHPGW